MFVPSTGKVEPIPADMLARLVSDVNALRGPAVAAVEVEEPIVIFVSPTLGQ
jgi:hypothetical protein